MHIIHIKYHSREIDRIEKIPIGEWVDLRAAEHVELKAGESGLISLGISMKLPSGYEAIIAPRSSTFKNFGVIQTNSIGIIDNSYSGDDDIWKMPVLAMRDTEINVNDRICQFRIVKSQGELSFLRVSQLGGESRGGFGSTGIN